LADACLALERGEPIDADVEELAAAARSRMQHWLVSAQMHDEEDRT
jgi:hypothetical protein